MRFSTRDAFLDRVRAVARSAVARAGARRRPARDGARAPARARARASSSVDSVRARGPARRRRQTATRRLASPEARFRGRAKTFAMSTALRRAARATLGARKVREGCDRATRDRSRGRREKPRARRARTRDGGSRSRATRERYRAIERRDGGTRARRDEGERRRRSIARGDRVWGLLRGDAEDVGSRAGGEKTIGRMRRERMRTDERARGLGFRRRRRARCE